MRRVLFITFAVGLLGLAFGAGVALGQKKNKAGMPTSVLHIVTLNWKAEATAEQRQKALDGIKTMGEKIPGIKNIWLEKLRSQMGDGKSWDQIFAIEFASKAAAEAYVNDPAHKAWEEIYTAARQESRSHQVTNPAPGAMKK
ncbi:MAG: Dabb family protein [Blastocatellia bacterium]